MSAQAVRRAGVVGVLCASWAVGAASEPPALQLNPFSRPPSEAIRAVDTASEKEPARPSSLDLRATLVAQRGRLANVGGKILEPGDEVDGFTLIGVFEDRAEFEFQGRQIVVFVKTRPGDDDD